MNRSIEAHIRNMKKVFMFLRENGGASPADIAKLLGVSNERGRQILVRLEKDGYVKTIGRGVRVPTKKFWDEITK